MKNRLVNEDSLLVMDTEHRFGITIADNLGKPADFYTEMTPKQFDAWNDKAFKDGDFWVGLRNEGVLGQIIHMFGVDLREVTMLVPKEENAIVMKWGKLLVLVAPDSRKPHTVETRPIAEAQK